VFVKEYWPGGGALDSKPQATMASMVPYCDRIVELAAAYVSSRMRTSDIDLRRDFELQTSRCMHSLGLDRRPILLALHC
jgi:hypothetical protein